MLSALNDNTERRPVPFSTYLFGGATMRQLLEIVRSPDVHILTKWCQEFVIPDR